MTDASDAPGLKSAVARFAGSALALARTRLELAGVEFAEERERLQVRLALLFAGVLLLVFALLGLATFVVVLFWETNRFAAILGASATCAVAGVVLVLRARAIGRDAPAPFSATLAEFDKDRQWLTGRGPEA